MSIRIVVADDHRIIREGILTLLKRESGIEVVGEAENGKQVVELALQLRPDVIVMDITMPGMNGIEATRQILANQPAIKIIALSMHSDHRFITGVVETGAVGYLLKDCAFDELARAIWTVMEGKVYLSPMITGIVVGDYLRRLNFDSSASVVLTDREREILQLIAEGHTSNFISDKLNLSPKTIESHRKRIMDKLNIHTVAELTKYAIREGLTSLED